MEIRVKETGAVMQEHEFRAMHPNVSGPLDALYDVVLNGQQAAPTRYQVAFRDGVEEIDGQWFTKYSVADIGAEATAAKDAEQATSVRATRDAKIAECDWRVIKALESGAPPDFAWAAYRQALRDVTKQDGFPWEINWPEQPE